jgi:LPXTG-motif cell wall-anchored protein
MTSLAPENQPHRNGVGFCQMRRRLPWLLALPVMAAGSLAAHSLSYLFVSARAAEGGAEASERASTGSASYLLLILGILAATAFVAAGLLLVRRRRRGVEVSPWLFFVLPPLAFALQELAERLLHAEAFPFRAALEPRFLLGLLLQLPFGLLALLVARSLLRVVERLVCALARASTPRLQAAVSWSLLQGCDLPRIPALALGYPQRGPPAL